MGIIRIYQWLFSSFVPNGEITLIDELVSQGLIRAMLLKRTWLFGVFLLLRYVPLLILLNLLKVYCVHESFPLATLYTNILIGIVSVLAFLSVASSILYIIAFRKIHVADKEYKTLEQIHKESKSMDRKFARFFNSVTLNYFILVILIFVEFVYAVFVEVYMPESFDFQGAVFVFVSIVSSISQILIFQRFRKHMIDIEMDYAVITINKIYIKNQENMLSSSRVIERGKMRGITASFPGYLGSILKYGNIEILMEGTSSAIHIEYINRPVETVDHINRVIKRATYWGDNVFLMKIIEGENIENPQSDIGKESIRNYLRSNEESIKQEFLARNPENRKEIESVLREYY